MIVALAGQKGGVGKSTIAIALAAEAFARGRSVLLVDADPQGTARVWSEVAAEAGRRTPTTVAMGATMHKPGQLERVAAGHDLVIIDCPGKLGEIQRSALMVADLVALPCGPSASDTWALAASLELVNEAKTMRPQMRAAIIITRKQARTALGRVAREALEATGLDVLRTELGYRVAYQEALATGQGVTEYAPRDPAAAEVRALLDELLALAGGKPRGIKESGRRRAPQAGRAAR